MAPRPAKHGDEPPSPAFEANDARVVLAGTALWALAFVVLVVLHLVDAVEVRGWWLGMCAYGVLLGLVGHRYVRRREAAIARDRSA